jgi:N6-adenosine-specific RNA methylase IME4
MYQIVYADPPWQFTKGFWDRSASRPESHYATMTTEDICNLDIPSIVDTNCHLYLWTTSRHLMDGDAIKVCKSWGFNPKDKIDGIGNKSNLM